ncbi:hypothetical protein [Actinobacillus genomosp. 1]|uniref:hypothetical protein n=1 Tax=Actinobacillus genomosp. 1 TaxID=254839 RepID=UPI00244106F6|nr:hypothetical protein [Actinobacillus genomosp. 1]WGE91809.1 hypothetical protein NYR63_02350 [Actinobacillus genomosp. 1]
MNGHSQFISGLTNRQEPLISFKELISLISNYTNKTLSKVADELEGVLFGFRQNRSYINSFCYCTIFDHSNSNREIYEPMADNFKDAFDYVKGHLKDVISRNSLEIENLDLIFVRASEFSNLIKNNSEILEKSISQPNIISQNRDEYISLYDLLEWANSKYYGNLTNTTYEFLALLKENNQTVPIYQYHKGIKDRLTKLGESLNQYLKDINSNHGYKNNLYDDTPF